MSVTRFKQPIQLPSLSSAPSEVVNGMLYYDDTNQKVVLTQDGEVTDTVSTQDLNDSVGVAIDEIDAHIDDLANPHSVTKAQVGLGNAENTSDLDKVVSNATQVALNLKANQSTTYSKLQTDTLLNGKENVITATISTDYYRGDKTFQPLNKAAVGLNNVDNTSDLNKPISTATQTTLDLKANLASPTFTGTVSGITKSMVGLGNVDNTSDATKNSAIATLTNKTLTSPIINSPTGIVKSDVGLSNADNTSDLNKPISTATQTALNGKQPLDAKLTSLSALATDGILVKSGINVLTRSVTVTSPIVVTNGDGVSGNIALSHATSGVTAASYGAEDKSVVLTVNALGHVTGASVVDTKPKKLNYIRVADTTTVSTTSSTPSTITSMTVTPTAGTYMCTFSGNIRGEGTPHVGTTSFFLDSTQIATTVRTIENTAPLLGTPTHAISAGQISDIVTFNGSQVLTVRFNATSGTVFCLARTLILIRVD